MSEMTNNKKNNKLMKAIFISIAVILTILLFPMVEMIKDGGTRIYTSRLGIYRIVKYKELRGGPATVIDGVNYTFPGTMRYRKGILINLFGKIVYENTYIDPPEVENVMYEEDITGLIRYYNSHRVKDVELRGIHISSWEGKPVVYLHFLEVSKLEVADEICKVIKNYLNENVNSTLFGNCQLHIDGKHDEKLEKTRTYESWIPYEADYILDLPDKTNIELILSPAMIPESVPSDHDFENVKTIDFYFSSKINENKERVLRTIFPNAKIKSE